MAHHRPKAQPEAGTVPLEHSDDEEVEDDSLLEHEELPDEDMGGTTQDNVDRSEELTSLEAIFEGELSVLSPTSLQIRVASTSGATETRLTVRMPRNYPSAAMPRIELSAPTLKGRDKWCLLAEVKREGCRSLGTPVVFQMATRLKELLDEHEVKNNISSASSSSEDESSAASSGGKKKQNATSKKDKKSAKKEEEGVADLPAVKCPEILTGECIEDRRSVFQAHFAEVTSPAEVPLVLQKLKANRKIAAAKHNIYAYRINSASGGVIRDNDDDGEAQAGGRLAHLLELAAVENTLVVVTRWFGGIKIGADRFKHINTSARNILEAAGKIKSTSPKERRKGAAAGSNKKANKR